MTLGSPPIAVLRAFGVYGSPVLLPGGQGTSWRAGHLVFKPDEGTCHEWLGTALSQVEANEVRIAKPVTTRHGAWRHEGWAATEWVPGVEPDGASESRWRGTIQAARAFHRAVAHLSRPGCLDDRRDPWAAADRAAWGESSVALHPYFASVASRLRGVLRPLGPRQLVHGDLTGNVLFKHDLPVAVIDLSPYWRPVEYAEGVVVADALCWHDAPPSLVADLGVSVGAVARALLFRMLTTSERVVRGHISGLGLDDEAQRYERAASVIGL